MSGENLCSVSHGNYSHEASPCVLNPPESTDEMAKMSEFEESGGWMRIRQVDITDEHTVCPP